jgi:hypothetical protein
MPTANNYTEPLLKSHQSQSSEKDNTNNYYTTQNSKLYKTTPHPKMYQLNSTLRSHLMKKREPTTAVQNSPKSIHGTTNFCS